MSSRPLLVLALALLACDTAASDAPALRAGTGDRLMDLGGTLQLEVDAEHVPVLPDCSAGQVVHREGISWTCRSPAPLPPGRLDSLESKLAHLTPKLSALTASAAQAATDAADVELRARMLASSFAVSPELAASASGGCQAREDSIDRNLALSDAEGITFRPNTLGTLTVFCTIFATSSATTWNTLDIDYDDPDGAGTRTEVSAAFRWLQQPAADVHDIINPSASSNDRTLDPDPHVMIIPLEGHVFDFERRFYYLQLSLTRTTTTLAPRLRAFRVYTR